MMLADPVYKAKFEEDFRNRRVDPSLEKMVWAYGYGEPRKQIDLTVDTPSLEMMDPKQLLAQADDVRGQLLLEITNPSDDALDAPLDVIDVSPVEQPTEASVEEPPVTNIVQGNDCSW